MKTDIIDLILARRSASPRRLVAPVPTAAELQQIVQAAASAPDHKDLKPFRFILIPPERRDALAAAFRAAKQERDPAASEDELARAGEKAYRGAMLLGVVLRIVRDHPRVSATDQIITAGAALQNALLAASALGYSASLRSGTSATSRTVRLALGLAPHEELAAYMMLGTADAMPATRDVGIDLLSTWSG